MNMKAINIKLATFSFAAMLLASCSDSGTPGNDSVIDPIGKAATIVGSNVTAEYADQLASRVRNYKGAYATTTTKTRALATRAETTEPTVPAGTPNLSSIEKEIGTVIQEKPMLYQLVKPSKQMVTHRRNDYLCKRNIRNIVQPMDQVPQSMY